MTAYASLFAAFASLSPDHLIALVALAALGFAVFALLWIAGVIKALAPPRRGGRS